MECKLYPTTSKIALTNVTRVILMNYREDGVTPFVTVWKHGLTEMKV